MYVQSKPYVCNSSPYVQRTTMVLISQNIKKKLNIEPKIRKSDQNECKYELFNTLTLAMMTITPNIKLPSKVNPPNQPCCSVALFNVINVIAQRSIPYQTAYPNHRQNTDLLKNTSSSPALYSFGWFKNVYFDCSQSKTANHMIGKAVKTTL